VKIFSNTLRKIKKFILLKIFLNKSKIISQYLNKILTKKISVYDLGAGGRYLSTLYKFDGISKIYMIDPNENLEISYNNFLKYFRNKKDVKKFKIGISSENKKLKYYPALISTGSTFKKIDSKKKIENVNYFGEKKGFFLKVAELSSLIKKHNLNKPDIIKIDIEGMEFEIINSILKKYKPFIIEVELNLDFGIFKETFTQTHNKLKKNNYILNTLYPAFEKNFGTLGNSNYGFGIGNYDFPISRNRVYQLDGFYHLKREFYDIKELCMLIGYGFVSESYESFNKNIKKYNDKSVYQFVEIFKFLKC
jgi:FkbM family methyltransferase